MSGDGRCERVFTVHAELGEICAGGKPGRVSPDEVTVFDSTGCSFQDIVVAGYVLGENRQVIEDYAGTYQNAVLAAGFLTVAAFVVVRVLAARRNRQRV